MIYIQTDTQQNIVKLLQKENLGQRGKIRALHHFLLVVKSNIDDIPLFA